MDEQAELPASDAIIGLGTALLAGAVFVVLAVVLFFVSPRLAIPILAAIVVAAGVGVVVMNSASEARAARPAEADGPPEAVPGPPDEERHGGGG